MGKQKKEENRIVKKMADYVMEAKHVFKTYRIKGEKRGDVKVVEAVKDVSLQIRKGDIKLIFGPSGSGKSTFLRCMDMLDIPDQRRNLARRRMFNQTRHRFKQGSCKNRLCFPAYLLVQAPYSYR